MTWRNRHDEVVVYSSLTTTESHLIHNLLVCRGIPARVRNFFLAPLAGEIPLNDTRAEVVVRPEHREVAEQLIAEAQRDGGDDRPCPACREDNPPSFEICWSCGVDLPLARSGLSLVE